MRAYLKAMLIICGEFATVAVAQTKASGITTFCISAEHAIPASRKPWRKLFCLDSRVLSSRAA
jgi:hypothetical protein